ncbi:MAG: amidohydrolase family protein, partial [Clostridia bacterium]|nr:amidohydrolase family protein [Clostridia bacterium]
RVMFGSDYPMWDPGKELEILLSLGLSEEEERLILGENAIRLFGLEKK